MVNTKDILPDNEHKYTVTCEVTDFANNSVKYDPYTVYIDCSNPTIEKYTVENTNKALDNVLHILSFGIYSNDSLKFTVTTSEEEYDSGIDYLDMNYEGLKKPIRMKSIGKGKFTAEIGIGTEVFDKEIQITAYDKYGKRSISCPDIQSGHDSSSSKRVMIEDKVPVMQLNLPKPDGIERTDGQIWYRRNKSLELITQDKDAGIRNIKLTVNSVEIIQDKEKRKLLATEGSEKAKMFEITVEGKTYHHEQYFASKEGDWKVGDEVTIKYNPDNPEKMFSQREITSHKKTAVGRMIGVALLGLMILRLGYLVYR